MPQLLHDGNIKLLSYISRCSNRLHLILSWRSQREKAAQHCTANSLIPKATAGDREMGIKHSRWRHKDCLSPLHPQQAPFLFPSSLVYPATKPVNNHQAVRCNTQPKRKKRLELNSILGKTHPTSIYCLERNSNQKWKKHVLAQKKAVLF